MIGNWKDNIDRFILLSNRHQVRMLMFGGGAVNFHGYQRHSADVCFWLDVSEENLKKLTAVFNEMVYGIEDFPESVKGKSRIFRLNFLPRI